jgi:hypothetical protein
MQRAGPLDYRAMIHHAGAPLQLSIVGELQYFGEVPSSL